MKIILPIALFFIVATACQNPESGINSSDQNIGNDNELVRTYLSPKRILWSTESGLQNTSFLLEESNGQADLVGSKLCEMKGNGKQAPSLLLDFGQELHGGIEVVTGAFPGKAPIKIQITLGESVTEAMSNVENSSATNDHAIRDFSLALPWLGKVEIGNSGFRFARITLLDTDRTLLLKSIRAISIYRDIPWLGSFHSSDERLNEIWQVGARTVHLNMQEYLWDGIKRDRLVWVGDMHPEVMTILSVFGYNEVVPKSLDLISSITEPSSWMNGISSYSMWWILIQYQWYMNNGDFSYLESNSAYIFDLLETLREKIDMSGKESLDGNRFLDWPTSPNKKAIHAGLQSLMVMTFHAGAEIASYLDQEDLARQYVETANRLLGYIPDPNGNKAAGALLALSGLADAGEINDILLSANPLDGISTFYGYYVLQARAMAGDYQGALDVIRHYWGGMLDLGATTFWEDFNLDWAKNASRIDELPVEYKDNIHADFGDYCYVGLRHSLCHGWASGPTAWLSEHVLGIEVLEPGCSLVRITPHLGDLEWVEGSYPTPQGVIKLRHERMPDGSINSNIDLPDGIRIAE
jgi:hypothetical protein